MIDDCETLVRQETLKLLYLDDDEMDQVLMRLALRDDDGPAKLELKTATTIEEARTILDSEEIDIFITDNRMPGSIDFHVTLSRLGKIDPETKIIVVSSETQSQCFHRMDDLARKPDAIIEKTDLREGVRAGLFRVR